MKNTTLFLLYFLILCNFGVVAKTPSAKQILDLQLQTSSSFQELITRRFPQGWEEIPLSAQKAIAQAVAHKLTQAQFSSMAQGLHFKVIVDNQPSSVAGRSCLKNILELLLRKYRNVRLPKADADAYALFGRFEQFSGIDFKKNGGYSAECERDRFLQIIREQAEESVAKIKDGRVAQDLQSSLSRFVNQARALFAEKKLHEFVVLTFGAQYLFARSSRDFISLLPLLISAITSCSKRRVDGVRQSVLVDVSREVERYIKQHNSHALHLAHSLQSYCSLWDEEPYYDIKILKNVLLKLHELYRSSDSLRLISALKVLVVVGTIHSQQKIVESALECVFSRKKLTLDQLINELHKKNPGNPQALLAVIGNLKKVIVVQ